MAEAATPTLSTPELTLLDALGEGGTAVVTEAQEAGLLRHVAVKAPRAPHFAAQLEQEARVLSALEHPHILPLFALLPGPRLVLPKLEGHRLDAIIADPSLATETRRGESHEAFIVRVLVALCDALAHAHDRRILHRDLKPDNLMLGSFGEIYVLDWGHAVSLDPDDPRPLPRAVDVEGITGTPYYLSPEQALTQPLTEQTDLFAVGCILHELLTGQRRNPGRSRVAILAAAQRPVPVAYDDTVDPDLADLANELTAESPSDRAASAQAVRQRLLEWGQRHQSRALLAEVDARLPLFRRARDDEGAEALALQLLAELEGTLHRALDLWPGNPIAADRLDEVTRDGVRLFVRTGNLSHAREILASLGSDDALTELLDAAEADAKQQERELAALEAYRETFRSAGRDRLFRALLGVAGGVATAALTLAAVFYHRVVADIDYRVMVPLAFLFGVMMMATVLLGSVRKTIGSRRYARQFGVLSAMVPLQWAACAWLGLPMQAAVAWNMAMSGAALVAAGASTSYLPSVLGGVAFLLGFVAAVLLPQAPIEILALSSVLAFAAFSMSHALLSPPPEPRRRT